MPRWNNPNCGFQKGYKMTEEHKQKLRDYRKGKKTGIIPKDTFQKGHTPWNKDRKNVFSKSALERMKQSHIGKSPWNKGQKCPQLSGENQHNWKGGKTICNGYFIILKPEHPFCDSKGYIYEHRFVIEKYLGRYLLPKEITHHLGNKDDNRPHMLMAFSGRGAHKRFHYNPNNVKSSEIIFDGRKIIK